MDGPFRHMRIYASSASKSTGGKPDYLIVVRRPEHDPSFAAVPRGHLEGGRAERSFTSALMAVDVVMREWPTAAVDSALRALAASDEQRDKEAVAWLASNATKLAFAAPSQAVRGAARPAASSASTSVEARNEVMIALASRLGASVGRNITAGAGTDGGINGISGGATDDGGKAAEDSTASTFNTPQNKPDETELSIDAMLAKVPDDVLLQQVRKRKIIDLTADEDTAQEPDGSGLALQTLVKVKKEKADAEESLAEAKEEVEDADDEKKDLTLFIDRLQSQIDNLAKLAEEAGVDKRKINEIRYHS